MSVRRGGLTRRTVCTDILHLQHRKLSCYRGTYDNFEKARNEKRRQLAKQAESQEKRRKHMEE